MGGAPLFDFVTGSRAADFAALPEVIPRTIAFFAQTHRWLDERLGLRVQPVDAEIMAWMLSAIGGPDATAIKVLVGKHCCLSSVDARRNGNRVPAGELFGARLKELSRRHRRLRQVAS